MIEIGPFEQDSPQFAFCARLLAQMFNLAMAGEPKAVEFLLTERAQNIARAIGMAPQVLDLFTIPHVGRQFRLPGL